LTTLAEFSTYDLKRSYSLSIFDKEFIYLHIYLFIHLFISTFIGHNFHVSSSSGLLLSPSNRINTQVSRVFHFVVSNSINKSFLKNLIFSQIDQILPLPKVRVLRYSTSSGASFLRIAGSSDRHVSNVDYLKLKAWREGRDQ
jgi:hypothetical protein